MAIPSDSTSGAFRNSVYINGGPSLGTVPNPHMPRGAAGHRGPMGQSGIQDWVYEDHLPSWSRLNALAKELGESTFMELAPNMYREWLECRAIVQYRKTQDLIGGTNDRRRDSGPWD